MSAHARPLAASLASASDAQLDELLRTRGVRPDVPWNDFFDAAEALLAPASVERALASLTRSEAEALIRAADGLPAGAETERLTDIALLDAEGRVPPPVATVLRQHPLPDAPAGVQFPSSERESAHAAERAFTTVGSLADLLLVTRAAPLSLVSSGALSAADKRRISEAGAVAGDLDLLHGYAEIAGLVRASGGRLYITAAAEDWLASSFADRWAALALAFRDSLPRGVRSEDDGWVDVRLWPHARPWDPAWPEEATRLRRRAGMLGLLGKDRTETPWAEPLRNGGAPDTAALTALLPGEVDRVFLQNDLTAIAPGPLQPALDTRLRAMTEYSPAAQASSYRFTAESVAGAVAAGESAESILGFLREVSLTGVPQPLEYLVSQTAARHGLVRVGPHPIGGAVIASADEDLLTTIEVDRRLRPLGLHRVEGVLRSRVGPRTTTRALTDARYPAMLVDADDRPAPLRPQPFSEEADHPEEGLYAPLIARLRASQGPDADADWLGRELDAAVRARANVLVEVAMPDGSTRELTLEASGLGGGRLRGLDRAADVERTLPVRSIRSARILDS